MIIKPTFTESFQKCNGSIDWRMKDIELLYNENYLNYDGDRRERIPKIFHYIWVGGNPFPQKYQELVDIWKENHPRWEFKLWDEAAVEKFGLENYELYKRTPNPYAKTNIARFEILNRCGGIYIDTDLLSTRSIDNLLYLKFFAGYSCYMDRTTGPENVIPNIVGSCSNNDMLRNIINKIKLIQNAPTTIPEIIRDGPQLFSDVLMDELDAELTVLFPPSYFYPLNPQLLNEQYKTAIKSCKISELLNFIWKFAFMETYAIHLFYGSWQQEKS